MLTDDNNYAYQLFRKRVEQFCPIGDEDWNMLRPHLKPGQLRKHELFACEGKRANEIGFVLDGMFRQYYTRDGEEKTTYFFFDNHFISSYISCITQQPSLVSIEALSPARYIGFSYQVMTGLFEKSMAWQKFGRLMAEYLTIGLEERMVSLLLQTPEERYLGLLNSNKTKILERVPQHYIANYLGITPVSLSRIRNRHLKR